MASTPLSSRTMHYDPLPLTGEEPQNTLYNAPPSPDPHIHSFPPDMREADFSGAESAIPAGAAAPRFLGPALYDDPTLRPRESFSSSFQAGHSHPPSEYNSSVYALNDQNPRFDGGYRDNPHDSYYGTDPNAVPLSSMGQQPRMLEEKRAAYAAPAAKSRKKIIILAVLAGLILLILAVVIPLYFAVIRPRSTSGGSNNKPDNDNKPTATDKPNTPQARIVTGGDGSEITLEDGTKYTYKNSFGGYWYYDEEDPFNNGARAQSWSPALNETFHYGTDKIRG